jgi:hypothetical protein
MFERVGSLAERMATNVSRRAFLGRLGQGALVLAGAMGAMLALPGLAQAKGCGSPGGGGVVGSCCCTYLCSDGTVLAKKVVGQACQAQYKGCPLAYGLGC